LNIYKRTGIELQDISQNYDRQILEKKDIKIIYPDSKHHVWIGTSKGIFIIYRNKKTVEPVHAFASDPALQNDYITCVEEDAQGQIWIGLENGGVKKFDPRSKKITTYSTQNGLPANKVLGILTDKKGWLWISTGNGLAALNPTNESFRIFTKVDGLPSNSFNYNAFFKDEQGMLYFGTYKGMVCFDPENIYNNTTDAPIVFTSLKLLKETTGIDISHTKNLKLTYTQNVFTIEFALLNYIKPKKNRYAYMLKGFDDTWTETNTPAVTYMNLKPGHYTLSIKGRNNDGHWSSTTELSIVILPPFWRTWWAYLSYLILTATILFFITRFFYLRELIKKEEALHQNKLNFFTNVTHEIRTHLALIMSPVEKMITDRTSDTYLQTQLQSIQRNADSLLNLSEELMDFRKADTGNVQLRIGFYDIVKFVQEIYESFRQMALSRNIQTSFTHNIPAFELYFDKEQLEKIFFNLISNAFKFTPDGGKINVAISEENDTIKVAVSDNGRGISAAHKDKLFNNFFQVNDHASQNKGYGIGLALANKIAQLHGARIEVDSCMNEENGGERKTTFTVLFPKQPADFTKTDTNFSSATTI
jgi:signal transduction histidine kinase